MDLQPLFAQLQLHPVGRAVGRQQHGRRPHLLAAADAHGAGRVHPRHHVRVVDEVAEDGQRPLARQAQRQVHGVAHPETHAVMLGHADLHGYALSLSVRTVCPWLPINVAGVRGSGRRLAAALADDGFETVEVAGERLSAGAGELAARLRPAADELLVDGT